MVAVICDGWVLSKNDGKVILLMVQKSGKQQLRLLVDPIPSCARFYTSQLVVWDFFHKQYRIEDVS